MAEWSSSPEEPGFPGEAAAGATQTLQRSYEHFNRLLSQTMLNEGYNNKQNITDSTKKEIDRCVKRFLDFR